MSDVRLFSHGTKNHIMHGRKATTVIRCFRRILLTPFLTLAVAYHSLYEKATHSETSEMSEERVTAMLCLLDRMCLSKVAGYLGTCG